MANISRGISLFAVFFITEVLAIPPDGAATPIWDKVELEFTSSVEYGNPLYDVKDFKLELTSPGGREFVIHGFWDGGRSWKARFMPDETGRWSFTTQCSDKNNSGLHGINGTFDCEKNGSNLEIYSRGALRALPGSYHLTFADGAPFFWLGCTAWNGLLKSSDEEWDVYLENRAANGYNLIQCVVAPWRGCEVNRLGQVAFTGSGRIKLNPEYFQFIDKKIDRINSRGLVAAPVLLWVLQFAQGRELSPGYYLPQEEAILLARYMVARYGGNHVVWMLGGDGKYVDEYEQRWKVIGRGVFGNGEYQGLVTTHPNGHSWYGDIYADEPWLDVVGYQSSHSTNAGTIEFITKGPASRQWDKLPARPTLNMEPVYERIVPTATPLAVRNASYWSVLATPPAGVTYGTNALWSWLREGETLLNHGNAAPAGSEGGDPTWRQALDLPAGRQLGLLAGFFRGLEWWDLRPAQHLLAGQPGDENAEKFISVAASADRALIVVYLPGPATCELYNPSGINYKAEWFNPVDGSRKPARLNAQCGRLSAASPLPEDAVLVLRCAIK